MAYRLAAFALASAMAGVFGGTAERFDIETSLGGEEYAEDIVRVMDLVRVEAAEASLERFLGELKAVFNGWWSR